MTLELVNAFRDLRIKIELEMTTAPAKKKPELARALRRVKRQEKEAQRYAS